mmetsp:Transcript_28371/g.90278  ORF Transcript_28371/g.90278 Transcript_28371/m.90278 type:complete len:234 (-) Transcript_28371:219-920(-)
MACWFDGLTNATSRRSAWPHCSNEAKIAAISAKSLGKSMGSGALVKDLRRSCSRASCALSTVEPLRVMVLWRTTRITRRQKALSEPPARLPRSLRTRSARGRRLLRWSSSSWMRRRMPSAFTACTSPCQRSSAVKACLSGPLWLTPCSWRSRAAQGSKPSLAQACSRQISSSSCTMLAFWCARSTFSLMLLSACSLSACARSAPAKQGLAFLAAGAATGTSSESSSSCGPFTR